MQEALEKKIYQDVQDCETSELSGESKYQRG